MSAWQHRIACLFLAASIGCGATPQPQGGEPTTAPTVSVPSPNDPTKPPKQVDSPNATASLERDRLHQPFEAAVSHLAEKSPPVEANRPPDRTLSGKPVFSLYQAVKKDWDSIRFTSAASKKITWTASIETDRGVIELAFFPEQAPNHVRNFLALCQVGYYDGLCFERKHEEASPDAGTRLEHVEFGCPEGSGEPGHGSIGYWLKQEFNTLPHEEGTLAAIRGFEEDTAACRCYITLSRAPFLDGKYTVFGKVTKGLDVARIIFQQPVAADEAMRPGSRKLAQPVKIRKVTIQKHEG